MRATRKNSDGSRSSRSSRSRSGGAKIGTGAHGITYNVGTDTAEPTLHSLITASPIKSITLYTANGTEVDYTDPAILAEFVAYIAAQRKTLAKVFKEAADMKKEFVSEIAANKRIIDIYGDKAAEYLTMAAVPPFRGHNPVAVAAADSKKTTYAIFITKCLNNYEMDLDRFTVDILESIIVLQNLSFLHNDIKLDNVVLCNGRYKLIDWGQCGHLTDIQKTAGTLLGTNPIRWYILGHPHMIAKSMISFRTTFRYMTFSKTTIFRDNMARINGEYNEVVSKSHTKAGLLTKYAYSLDVFMLGMAMLHAVYKYDLSYAKYGPLIEKFTSLTDPVRNAFEALRIAETHLFPRARGRGSSSRGSSSRSGKRSSGSGQGSGKGKGKGQGTPRAAH
jgi:hypothetical protein